MKQQEILQELKKHGGSLAEAAAKEIETLAAQMPEWIDVKESLPKATDKHRNCLGVSVSDINIR